ncbi:cobalamin-binding protein [Limnochorda pilosa]|uniref:ABC transporter substrate-binding protein n=1 Tax=Limnochorda pilosa TaxID=1555112 RepID=A0A0K2SNB5_LIMPI|nr:cobalamin-binding protein [Limnochorda pilosa]BAS28623.1 ABC transporter substrate-binding protein [Limnochorda pilosa]
MRICSLLPSAPELLCALGLQHSLVGVTHECDHPPEVRDLPAVTRSLIPAGATGAEIESLVRASIHEHRSLYRLDIERLEQLAPDLIVTQELCDVCAVNYDEVLEAARILRGPRRVISLEPMSLADVLAQLGILGRETDRVDEAKQVRQALDQRLETVRTRVQDAERGRPRVYCMEWLDPPWAAGHWVPEMVEAAGGQEVLGAATGPSKRIHWSDVAEARPDVVILAPCGFDLEGTLREASRIQWPAWWRGLPAVQAGQVYAVDASAYFSRPGPRVVDGVEILAQILHPEVFGCSREGLDWRQVAQDLLH